MNKKTQKKLHTLNQKVQRLRQQLAGAKKQADDPAEIDQLQRQITDAETEIARLKAES